MNESNKLVCLFRFSASLALFLAPAAHILENITIINMFEFLCTTTTWSCIYARIVCMSASSPVQITA